MILCGLFCAGKSSIGNTVARLLSLPFYDTDRLLEQLYKKEVRALWQDIGEEAFRDLETVVIRSLKKKSCIIAIGGGALLRAENRDHLKKIGDTVYLKASFTTIWNRLQKKGYPAFLSCSHPRQSAASLAEERFPLFEDFCDYTLETDKYSVDQCAQLLIQWKYA